MIIILALSINYNIDYSNNHNIVNNNIVINGNILLKILYVHYYFQYQHFGQFHPMNMYVLMMDLLYMVQFHQYSINNVTAPIITNIKNKKLIIFKQKTIIFAK